MSRTRTVYSAIENTGVYNTSTLLYQKREVTGDVKFKIGDEEIPAHKCILASLSPKYERQFYGNFGDRMRQVIEVNVPGLTADAFREFLQLFYLNPIELTEENIESVVFLAKESLAEGIYQKCIELLSKTLSITNVCKRYSIATLYGCDELLESCESMLKHKCREVVVSGDFVNCNRSVLVKILKFTRNWAPETIFEHCISWARRFCDENGQDRANNANLRDALGDEIVEQIKFETMALDEFMELNERFKSFLTATEIEKVFRAITQETHFSPYWFDEKISEDDTSVSVKYTLVDSMEPIDYVLAKRSKKMTLSSYHRASLDAVYFGKIFQQKGANPYSSISVHVQIVETEPSTGSARSRSWNGPNPLPRHTVIFNETNFVACDSVVNCFTLRQPIEIKPKWDYKVLFKILDSRPSYVSVFKYKQLALAYGFVVVCQDKTGVVSGVKLQFPNPKDM